MAEKKKKSIKKKDMTFKEYLEELGGRRKAAMESRIKESFPDEEFDPQEQKTPKPKNMKKGGPVHRMPDGTMMKGAKHGMEAGGYVLSADEKRRRKEFEGARAVKSNVGKKKMKHGGMVIVDRQYLKGK